MNIFTQSLKDSLTSIKQHKKLFTFIIILQLVFLITLSIVFVKYQVLMFQNLETITAGIQNIEVDESDLTGMLSGFSSVTGSYDALLGNVSSMIFWFFIIFLIGNGLLWSIVHVMVNKGKLLPYLTNFIIISLIVLLPTGFFLYKFFQDVLVNPDGVARLTAMMPYILLIIAYILISLFTLLRTPLSKYPYSFFKTAILKYYYMIPAVLISIGFISGIIYLAYLYAHTLPTLLLSLTLLILSFSFSKIYLVHLVKRLQ